VPELPEVESIRRTLERSVVRERVSVTAVTRTDIIGAPGMLRAGRGRAGRPMSAAAAHGALLDGARIAHVTRRGKQLAMVADDGRALVVHLGMSGRLVVSQRDEGIAPPHTHATWSVGKSLMMRFTDPRRFGALVPCAGTDELESHWRGLGPDALSIGADALAHALASRRTPIKAALLDQSTIAGLGNIYVDEILYRAGIHPLMRTRRASPHAEAIVTCMHHVLEAAIAAGGSTLRDYVDAAGNPGAYVTMHRVYGRVGQPCDRCQSTLRSISVGGRTTTFCPACQGRVRRVVHPL
jgi:formamidopyrimidine-DNA glycosylase